MEHNFFQNIPTQNTSAETLVSAAVVVRRKRRRALYSSLAIVVIVAGAFAFFGREKQPEYETLALERAELIAAVSVNGAARAADEANLAFERSGKVYKTYVRVGDTVAAGQVLASLNAADTLANLQAASARLASAEAYLAQYKTVQTREEVRLKELEQGARDEEIDHARIKRDDARRALITAQEQGAQDTQDLYVQTSAVLQDVYRAADEALHVHASPLFTDALFPTYAFVSSDTQAENDARLAKMRAEELVTQLRANIDAIPSMLDARDADRLLAAGALDAAQRFLNRLRDVTAAGVELSATRRDAFLQNIAAGRAAISAARAELQTHNQRLATQELTGRAAVDRAQAALDMADNELLLKRLGATVHEIAAQKANADGAAAAVAAQEAAVDQEKAGIAGYRAQLAKLAIRAPFAGTITRMDARQGEIAPAGAALVGVMTVRDFEIKGRVPEVDVADIAVGQMARVTLDAYPHDEWNAVIARINPAQETVDGVPTYEITLLPEKEDERILPGMSADITIETARRADVLAVPARAITTRDGERVVRILENGQITEAPVQTGIRGFWGDVEITDGLRDGDMVILYER